MAKNVAKAEVIRKRQLAIALAEKTGAKLKSAVAVVDFLFDEIAGAVVKGVKVNVKDFGIFRRRETAARIGHSPKTGEAIKIPASLKMRFTPSKVLREAMKTKKYAACADLSALCCCSAPAAKAAPAVKAAPSIKKAAPAAKKAAPVKKAAPAAKKAAPAAKKAAPAKKAPAKRK